MMRQFPALRGIAILLVVLNHSVFFATSAPAEHGLTVPGGAVGNFLIAIGLLGWLAVPTFLFISGNFFAYAAQGSPPKLSYKIVWVNFLHLIWPYLLWSCIYYLVLFFVQGMHLTVGGYIKSLLPDFSNPNLVVQPDWLAPDFADHRRLPAISDSRFGLCTVSSGITRMDALSGSAGAGAHLG
jgi:fucose 4-O-acetylase-like acetyltransferase